MEEAQPLNETETRHAVFVGTQSLRSQFVSDASVPFQRAVEKLTTPEKDAAADTVVYRSHQAPDVETS